MSWDNSERWAQLIAGQDCPLCHGQHMTNEQSFFVKEFPSGFLRLNRKLVGSGWYTLVAREHVTEIFQWTQAQRQGFFDTVAAIAATLKTLHEAVKINYVIFGNIVPHVHCHLVVRKETEDPQAPIRFDLPGESLSESEGLQWLRSYRSLR